MALTQIEIEQNYGQLLDRSAILKDRVEVSELSGGLTNRNIRVTTSTGIYVARISSNESSHLSIDRQSEFENSKIAASCGIGAPVFDFIPGEGLLVIGYLAGKTYTSMDVQQNLKRIASSVQQLHRGPVFHREFNMFSIQRGYQDIVLRNGYKIPNNYLDFSKQVSQLDLVLHSTSEGLVPCNNDLLPANFIDDQEKVWLIDYEYSGNNDRCFELGNIWSEAVLPIEDLEDLVYQYFGRARPDQFARAWLYAVFAKYGWTLWASIQDAISPIDFDFWSWGMEKYEDAQSLMTSQLFNEMFNSAEKKA